MNRMAETNDLRVRRTRKLLWEALLSLLETRSFESLSVQEICDTAMVHRTTFYKHFEDKYALLSFGLEQFKSLFAERSYEERILHPMQMFREFGYLQQCRSLLHSSRENPALGCLLQRHGEDALTDALREAENGGCRFPVPVDIVAAFYSGAVASLLAWWLSRDQSVPAERMDAYLARLIDRSALFPNVGAAAGSAIE